MEYKMNPADYLFETSWEVCNKVGGIHSVLATKSFSLTNQFKDHYILIGPDVWRDTEDNPEFEEDKSLFYSWREMVNAQGLRVKTGRWRVPGNPVTFIIDFTSLMPKKDDILASFWETYKLDSLSGQWDYLEPLLFGYAAGMVIESFVDFHLSPSARVIAQFNEWMSGGGVLYLHNFIPQIATVFTTHETVLGRYIAEYDEDFYERLEDYNPAEKAREMNVNAKHSLESKAAAFADIFTTVSELSARECCHFLNKEPDLITPNAFEHGVLPGKEEFDDHVSTARSVLTRVTEALTGEKLADNPFFFCISGRYEWHNKGIGLFIDVVQRLKGQAGEQDRDIVAFILVPANHNGPRKDLQEAINNQDIPQDFDNKILTHQLNDPDQDPCMKKIDEMGITNEKGNRVKIIYVPAYLNYYDGVFNMVYNNILMGMNLTLFPSFYEPWGETTMESLNYRVPAITSSKSGFATWVRKHYNDEPVPGLTVIERHAGNKDDAVNEITKVVFNMAGFDDQQLMEARDKAFDISKTALWKDMLAHYFKAYNAAFEKVEERRDQIMDKQQKEQVVEQTNFVARPNWKRLVIEPSLPEPLQQLNELANNLWWSWNHEAVELFKTMDPELWEDCEQNPIVLFENLNYNRLIELAGDKNYLKQLDQVYKQFREYMEQPQQGPAIAYFSMEYGLINSLKIFSGGLGVLAGDYLKEASDAGVNITAVGLLYSYGYFKQQISVSGDQMARNETQIFTKLPLKQVKDDEGNPVFIKIGMPGRTLIVRIWQVNVGRIKLYLMDTDHPLNSPQDQAITHFLYGGDLENRLKQEMLLGIGGIRTLDQLNLRFDLFHSNEGHSAFLGLERLRKLIMDEHLSFREAREVVRASTLFTTHTPVPAGHDEFPEDLLRTYFAHYPGRMKISWEEMMAMGRSAENHMGEKFNMSFLAVNLSQEVNGVSWLHEKVTKDIFGKLNPGYLPQELHIGHVTNGVHVPTWTASRWIDFYRNKLDEHFISNIDDPLIWKRIYNVPDSEIWQLRNIHRKELINAIRSEDHDEWINYQQDPRQMLSLREKLNEDYLTIGFARRFATYKRAHLLFKDLDRLREIVNNADRPVQFLFAGKAHPNDKAGQERIKRIVEISRYPEFHGKIVFLQNYDMNMAKKLVAGVDIWLNTPTRPLEASGTSGQKAVMNGALHFSVLDGWWYEGYQEDAGWALTDQRTYDDQEMQDELDIMTIYNIIEHDIAPMFYDRNAENIPEKWIRYVKNSIAGVAPMFTTRRMINDYKTRFYNNLAIRSKEMSQNDYHRAKDMAAWKKNIEKHWDSIKVLNVDLLGRETDIHKVGEEYVVMVDLDLNHLHADNIGVEIVFSDINEYYIDKQELEYVQFEGNKATYKGTVVLKTPGELNYGIRLFPKHPSLPHRQDCGYVRWV